MVKKLFLLGAAVFLLAGCQPNIAVNYGDSNVNGNLNAVVNTNQPVVATPPAAVATNLTGVINDIRLSDTADANGTVQINKISFVKETKEIFVSAYVGNAGTGLVVSADLIYLPTGDKIGPVSNNPSNGGDIISNFSFSKPTSGWPAGNYNVNINLSNGQVKSTPFIVQ